MGIDRFSSSAQLQQLESRLKYSKTDKETAEKRQRILIEKDLVDFQAKLIELEVGVVDPSDTRLFPIFLAEKSNFTSIDR
jgi:hypothetical protein